MQSHQGGGEAAVSLELAMTGRDAANVACRSMGPLQDAVWGYTPQDEVSEILLGDVRERMSRVMAWTVDAMNRTVLVNKDDVCMLREQAKALMHMEALIRHREQKHTVLLQLLEGARDECLETISAAEAAIRLASDVATEVKAAPLIHTNIS